MNEHFYTTHLIPKEKMSLLLEKSNHPALLRYVLMYALFIAMNFVVVYTWNKPLYVSVISQLCYAVLCCSIFASLHETGHGTAFQSDSRCRL